MKNIQYFLLGVLIFFAMWALSAIAQPQFVEKYDALVPERDWWHLATDPTTNVNVYLNKHDSAIDSGKHIVEAELLVDKRLAPALQTNSGAFERQSYMLYCRHNSAIFTKMIAYDANMKLLRTQQYDNRVPMLIGSGTMLEYLCKTTISQGKAI